MHRKKTTWGRELRRRAGGSGTPYEVVFGNGGAHLGVDGLHDRYALAERILGGVCHAHKDLPSLRLTRRSSSGAGLGIDPLLLNSEALSSLGRLKRALETVSVFH